MDVAKPLTHDTSMKLTRQFIMEHRTLKGSWTRSQIEALGIEWPPRQGWIDTAIGKEIGNQQVLIFTAKKPAKLTVHPDQIGLFD